MSDFEQGFEEFLKQEKDGQSPAQPQQVAPPEKQEAAPAPEAAAPVTQESANNLPFPNFDKLPEETQKAITERMERAEAARKEKEQEVAKIAHEYRALQGRLAPTQRELEQARKEAAELRKKQDESAKTRTPEQEKRLKELAELYPGETELINTHLGPVQAEIERLRKEREEFAQERQTFATERQMEKNRAELTQYRPTWQADYPTLVEWIKSLDQIDQQHAIELFNTPALSPDATKNNIRLWRMFERDEQLAKELFAQGEATNTKPARKTPDLDPNPRGRTSPGSPAASAPSSDFSEGFETWLIQNGHK